MPRRYFNRFTDINETLQVEFPHLAYEFSEKPELITPFVNTLGGQYGVDLLGFGPNQLGPRIASIRFVLDGDDIDDFETKQEVLVSQLRRIARGKLWTNHDHWCYARMTQAPELTYNQGEHLYMPALPAFRLDTDWYGAESVQQFTITSPSQDIVVLNPGTLTAYVMQITLDALSATGFNNPNLNNLDTGYQIGTTRDATSTSSLLRIKTGVPSIQYSSTDGASYADDYVNAIVGANQGHWMELKPISNTIRCTNNGTPNYRLTFQFFPVFGT